MSGLLGDTSSTSIRRRPTAGLSPNPLKSPYSLSPYLAHEEDSDLACPETYGKSSPKFPRSFHDSTSHSTSDGVRMPVEHTPYKENKSIPHPSIISHSRSHEVETSSPPFHAVPLTPEMGSRIRSFQGNVGLSRSTITSMPPRLPTPDFSLLREPLRQAFVAPLNFFRSRSARQSTNSQQTTSSSRAHLSRLTLKLREATRQSEELTFKLRETSSLPSYPVLWSPTAATADNKPQELGINLTVSEGGKETDLTFISNSWRWERGALFLSGFVVFTIGSSGLLYSLLLWFRAIRISSIVVITQYDLSLYITLISSMHLVTSVVGFTGAFLFSRTVIVCYMTLLLPNAAALLGVGCVAYQRCSLSLVVYLSGLWAELDSNARDVIQGTLQCCGFTEQEYDVWSALHNYVQSGNSGARSCRDGLQDCREALLVFEQTILSYHYVLGFSLLFLQLINLLVALLCDYRLNRIVGQAQWRPPNRVLVQAHAQGRALLRNIEDLIRQDQAHAHESAALPLEVGTEPRWAPARVITDHCHATDGSANTR